MRNEIKTGYKIIILFVVMAVTAVTTLFYFHNAKINIEDSKRSVEEQQYSLSIIKDLIYAVEDVQHTLHIYMSFRQIGDTDRIEMKILQVDSIAGVLSGINPKERDMIMQIPILLEKEYYNYLDLNNQLSHENPIKNLNEKLHVVHSHYLDTVVVAKTQKDSVVVKPVKKSFFQRFGALFKPDNDTVTTVFTSVDTIKYNKVDTLGFLSQAEEMARLASVDYEHNISTITDRINELLASNQELNVRINFILYKLHNNMLSSAIKSIGESKSVIDKNFSLSLIGGGVAMLLIFIFIVMIIVDINRVQKARNDLEVANKRVKDIMESRHKLMLATSHDIKSPLNSILGYLEMSDNKTEDVVSMQNSAKYILALLENMLNFSKIEQGTLSVTNTKISLKDLSKEIFEMFSPLAFAKNLKFTSNSNGYIVESDVMKIKQILINLTSNSVKYTSSGCVRVDLECVCDAKVEANGASSGGGLLKIFVSDTGAGIDKNELEHLFKPFYRVERNKTLASGNGYGMFVVKGLVDLLKGSISVDSEVNRGTVIEVKIPVGIVEAERVMPKRIVVFDDEPQIVDIAERMLRQLGHIIVEDDYDMILTDMDMSGITGLDVLASAGGIPVVLMTGRGDISEKDAVMMGFSGFIPKPLDIGLLRSIFGDAS